MREVRRLPLVARALLFVFARPRLLSLAMAGARALRATGVPALAARLPGRAGFAMAMLASTARPPAAAQARAGPSTTRGSVASLTGCVTEGLLAPVNRATESTLARQGYQVVEARAQRCCGALHAHAGDTRAAGVLARHNIAAFEASGAEFFAVNSAGCGSMLKEYGRLLYDDPVWRDRAAAFSASVRDVSELLASAGPLPASGSAVSVAYDAPCHLQHAQRITAPPLAVLRAIKHLELVPLEGSDQCCGSAGIYNLIQPDVSKSVLSPKLAAIARSGATVVATGNPGCLMQIGAGLLQSGSRVVARHPVELLAAAYEEQLAGRVTAP
jgi:glycolate oxidase iron-sulfur subunit